MPISLLLDTYSELDSAENSEDLSRAMEKFSRSIGFEKFVYALLIQAPTLPAQQYVLSGYPPKWFETYTARGYFKIDPIVKHAKSSTLPIIWGEEMFNEYEGREFWEEARSFGLNAGISFSVREQLGATGIFSLSRDKSLDAEGHELAGLIGRAQMFASLLHHAIARVDLPRLLPGREVALTERECECLKWSAEGKTAWEVGQILSISERTAVFHINNFIQKLGALNKTQAIVRALALKLV